MCARLCFRLYKVFMVCMSHFFFFKSFLIAFDLLENQNRARWRGGFCSLLSTLRVALRRSAVVVYLYRILKTLHSLPCVKPSFLPEIVVYPVALFTEKYLLAQTRRT